MSINKLLLENFTGKVAQKRRIIMVQNVHAKVRKRVETEVEKARRTLEQGEAIKLKKGNARIATHKIMEAAI